MKKRLQELEYFARKFREDNSLSDKEPIRIKSVLQKNDVLTIYRPISEGVSGMSIKINTVGVENLNAKDVLRFMLVNSNHSVGKQHFTICHELYHLYFQENFSAAISCAGRFDKKGNPEEFNADMFAVFLLLPQWGIYELIPEEERNKNKISISTMIAIEQYYSCSHSALLHRLQNIGLIDEAFKQSHLKGVKSFASLLGYDKRLYESGNHNLVIGNYGTLAYKAWEDGLISESTYYSLLSDLGVDISKLSASNENGED